MAKSNEKPKPPAKPKGEMPWDSAEATGPEEFDDGPSTIVGRDIKVGPPGVFAAEFEEGEETAPGPGPGDGPSTMLASAEEFADLAVAPKRKAPALLDEDDPKTAPFEVPSRAKLAGPAPAKKPTRGEMPVVTEPARKAAPPPAPAPKKIPAAPAPPAKKPTRASVPAAEPATRRSDPKNKPAAQEPESEVSVVETAPGDGGPRKNAKNSKEPAALSDEGEAPNTRTGMKVQDPAAKRWLMAVVAISVLVVGCVVVFGVVSTMREKPDQAELQLAYPYGFEGARGARGERAPGAASVQFKFLADMPCSTHTTCQRFQYLADGFDGGTMVMGKRRDGQWERVGEDGMPFKPVAPQK